MNKNQKHIVLVNAIFPPDQGASGVALFQLAERLQSNNLKVTVVTTNRKYNESSKKEKIDVNVIRVPSVSNRSSKWKRLWSAYTESRSLLKKAAEIKADSYVLCTDPPLINYFAAKYLKSKSVYLWAMDLYPHGFVANSLVKANNWIVKRYLRKLKVEDFWNVIALGEKQKMFLDKIYKSKQSFILPCGIKEYSETGNQADWKTDPNVIYFGYCGNIGEAHSAEFFELLVKHSDPTKHHFIISAIGNKSKNLLSTIKTFQNVTTIGWIDEDDISDFDIQIVTLQSEWTHICVPSKAVSSICKGTPILFHGSEESDTYSYFEKALWHIDGSKQMVIQIKEFYAELNQDSVILKKEQALKSSIQIREIYDREFNRLLKNIHE